MAPKARLVYEIAGQEFATTVGTKPCTIGRTQENDVILTGVGVSRAHCRIAPRGTELILTDLGSSNGTFVNSDLVSAGEEATLRNGDTIRVGVHKLLLEADPSASSALRKRSAARDRRNLELLLETVAQLHRELDPARILPAILDRVIQVTDADRGLILLTAQGDALEVSVARTKDGEDMVEVEGTSRSIPERVMASGESVCITGQTPDWSQASNSMVKFDLRSCLCVPVRVRGTIRGVIYVDSPEVATEFGEAERMLLEGLAAQCAIALERAELHRQEVDRLAELEAENAALKNDSVVRPLAVSPAMNEALRRIERVAGSDVTLLITGETGVGKEVVSRYVHALAHRSSGPFVVVDCGAIPEALIESVLFGHVKGAFTGATADQAGLARKANGGTLLLDEIGELPLPLQPKLLRFLEEQTFLPVGSGDRQKVDVRVVACTHRDLEAMAKEGTFREDLYFRLNAFPVLIPPLRDRHEDIVPLARLLLARERQTTRTPYLTGFTAEALAALKAYPWPGNVRELAHRVQRAAVTAEPPFITVTDLDLVADPDGAVGVLPLPEARKLATARFEREYVTELLSRHQGRVQKAAKEAGVSRQLFQRLMAKHGISRKEFLDGEGPSA